MSASMPAPGVLSGGQRLVAVFVAVAAYLVGVRATRSRLAAALTLTGPLAAAAWALAGRRRTDPPGALVDNEIQPASISVVIPARNEEAVIGGVLGDLGRQDLQGPDGAPGFEVVVVDDRSTDRTTEVARAAIAADELESIARVLRREPGSAPGKGAALAHAVESGLRGNAMVVLDADARIAPDFVRTAVTLLGTSTAITARRRMLRPNDGPWQRLLAEIQDDEQTIDGAIQAGRWLSGAGSELRGDGSGVRLDALMAAGGWDPGALCEDLELSGRLLEATGQSVRWDSSFVVWEQPAVELSALARQRLRWADGLVRRELRVTPDVLRSPALSPAQKAVVLTYSAQAVAPLAILGLCSRAGDARSWPLIATAAIGYAATTGALAAESFGPRHRVARALAVLLFTGQWLITLPLAWLRAALLSGPPHFTRTPHAAAFEEPDPSDR